MYTQQRPPIQQQQQQQHPSAAATYRGHDARHKIDVGPRIAALQDCLLVVAVQLMEGLDDARGDLRGCSGWGGVEGLAGGRSVDSERGTRAGNGGGAGDGSSPAPASTLTVPLEAPALRRPNSCSSFCTAPKGVAVFGGAAVAATASRRRPLARCWGRDAAMRCCCCERTGRPAATACTRQAATARVIGVCCSCCVAVELDGYRNKQRQLAIRSGWSAAGRPALSRIGPCCAMCCGPVLWSVHRSPIPNFHTSRNPNCDLTAGDTPRLP